MQRKGALYNKVLYKKYKTNKKTITQTKASNSDKEPEPDVRVAAISNQMEEMTLDEELSYLLYFKTCMVDREMEILKIKMQKTIALREKTIKKRETKFIESFPIYFVAPELVSMDFFICFVTLHLSCFC